MSYKETVKDKLERLPQGSEERVKLWERMCDAYEKGGQPELTTELDRDIGQIEQAIRKALKSIEALL